MSSWFPRIEIIAMHAPRIAARHSARAPSRCSSARSRARTRVGGAQLRVGVLVVVKNAYFARAARGGPCPLVDDALRACRRCLGRPDAQQPNYRLRSRRPPGRRGGARNRDDWRRRPAMHLPVVIFGAETDALLDRHHRSAPRQRGQRSTLTAPADGAHPARAHTGGATSVRARFPFEMALPFRSAGACTLH